MLSPSPSDLSALATTQCPRRYPVVSERLLPCLSVRVFPMRFSPGLPSHAAAGRTGHNVAAIVIGTVSGTFFCSAVLAWFFCRRRKDGAQVRQAAMPEATASVPSAGGVELNVAAAAEPVHAHAVLCPEPQQVRVTIPSGATSGSSVTLRALGRLVTVTVPRGGRPGMQMDVSVPSQVPVLQTEAIPLAIHEQFGSSQRLGIGGVHVVQGVTIESPRGDHGGLPPMGMPLSAETRSVKP